MLTTRWKVRRWCVGRMRNSAREGEGENGKEEIESNSMVEDMVNVNEIEIVVVIEREKEGRG